MARRHVGEYTTRTWLLGIPRWRTAPSPQADLSLVHWWDLVPMMVLTALAIGLGWSSAWPVALGFVYFLAMGARRIWKRGEWCEAHWHEPVERDGGWVCRYCTMPLSSDEADRALALIAEAPAPDDENVPQARYSNRR